MQVIGDFNNVSDSIKPRLLGNGEVVIYQMLNGTPDIYNPKIIRYPEKRIPTKDKIFDPGANNGVGGFVTVGIYDENRTRVNGNLKDGVILTKPKWVEKGMFGLIAVTGGNAENQEFFEYLELTNLNRSFVHRDKNVEPLFYRIDVVDEAKRGRLKTKELTMALMHLDGMKEIELREFAAAMNWNDQDEIDVVADMVGEMAKKTPRAFIDFFEGPNMRNLAMLKQAKNKGIIQYDVSAHRIVRTSNQTTMAILPRLDGKNELECFIEWINNSQNGSATLANIRKMVTDSMKASSNKLDNIKEPKKEKVEEPVEEPTEEV